MSLTRLLLTSIVVLKCTHARPPFTQQPWQISADNIPRIQFESGEHDLIGDSLKLRYPSRPVNGSDFNYNVSQKHGHTKPLSFGQLVTLGDYYGTYQTTPDFIPDENALQISDYWRDNRTEALTVFDKIINLVRTNYRCTVCDDGYLPYLSDDVVKEKRAAIKYKQQQGDVAQFYEDKFASQYETYSWDTTNAVTVIAWQNWDHFGQDAISAYIAGHSLALQYARLAHGTGNTTLLTEAYFAEAYAQHFLSDLFSTGHHRAPRRVLHGGLINTEAVNIPTPSIHTKAPTRTAYGDFPPVLPTTNGITLTSTGRLGLPTVGARDRLANYIHNEDCANGLFVENALGEQWPAYGDNQLFSDKSVHNLAQSKRAGQMGIDEIYKVFQTGQIPDPADFAALQIVPILADDSPTSNYQALFSYDAASNTVYKRAVVDQRNSSALDALNAATASYEAWDEWFSETSESGANNNMYPYTKADLATNTTLFQYREYNNSLVVTQFGNITLGNITTWDAKQQIKLALGNYKAPNDTWRWVSSRWYLTSSGEVPFMDQYHSLTATSRPDSGSFIVHHLTVVIPASNLSTSSIRVYSNATYLDDSGSGSINSAQSVAAGTIQARPHPFGEVLVLNGNPKLTKDPKSAATLIMSSLQNELSDRPLDELAIKIANAYAMMTVNIGCDHPNLGALIGAMNTSTATGNIEPMWYLAYWSSDWSPGNPAKPIVVELQEESHIGDLSSPIGTHLLNIKHSEIKSLSKYILRVGYNKSDSGNAGTLVMDILQPSFDSPQTITLVTRSTYTLFPESSIDLAVDKAQWFVSGTMATGVKLVGYFHSLTEASGGLVSILTFMLLRPQNEFVFQTLSTITNNTEIYPPQKLVTANFMRPVSFVDAGTIDAADGWPTIMEAFDNYGILGSRLVSPVKDTNGSYKYQLKGQTPALAGQMSTGLGWSDFGTGFGQGVGYVWVNGPRVARGRPDRTTAKLPWAEQLPWLRPYPLSRP